MPFVQTMPIMRLGHCVPKVKLPSCQFPLYAYLALSMAFFGFKISCHNLKANPPLLSTAKIGGNLMTQNCQKLEKYLFPGISGCILAPGMGGPGKSSCSEGSEYVWQRGEGSQKCLVRGNFQSVPCYRKRADQKPPLTRHFWPPTPLCHTYSETSGHKDLPGTTPKIPYLFKKKIEKITIEWSFF